MIVITLNDILDVIGIAAGLLLLTISWLVCKFGDKRGGKR